MDPQHSDVKALINGIKKKPFIYLLAAKVFFRHAVLVEQHAETQTNFPPATKATCLKNRLAKRKERMLKKAEMERDLEEAEIKKKQKIIEMDAQSRHVKADSMRKMSSGQNMKIYAELASSLYSPDTYRRKMLAQLENFEAHTLNFGAEVAATSNATATSITTAHEQPREDGRADLSDSDDSSTN